MNGMTYVQLGWLQDAINWVYDHALSPVFNKIQSIMSEIMKLLFENILLPILEAALSIQVELVKTLFENFIYDKLFQVSRVVLWALDAVEGTFRMFAGIDPVYVQNGGKMERQGSLLLALVKSDVIRQAMLGMILASFALCFLVAVIATVKSVGDISLGDKKGRPVGKVMRMTAQALLRFILIPVMALFMVALGDAVMKAVVIATNPHQSAVSDILFTMSTLDAVREQDFADAVYYNSSTRSAALSKADKSKASQVADFGLEDKYRLTYYRGDSVNSGIYNHKKRTLLYEVLKTFDIRRMDYLLLIGGAILYIYLLGIMAVSMIARIFDSLLLLLVEPFFAATMPMDDGERFKKWQELFLGRLFSGYGTVVGMNVYLSVIGLVFSGKIAFFGEGTTPAVDYITRMAFTLAGAYAITQVGPVVTGILSAEAGRREGIMMTQGATITTSIMKIAAYPVKKVAGYVFDKGVDSVTGYLKDKGLMSGGNPTPGVGDAFGSKNAGNGPENVQFNGSKTEPGSVTPQTGTQFTGTKNDEGKPTNTQVTPKRNEAMSDLLSHRETEDDGFETIFDVGGKSLFDEETDESSQAFTGTASPHTHGEPGAGGGLDTPYYGFLNAGSSQQDPYVWIGQRDEQERKEREAYEKQLSSQLDEMAQFAAESSTGMDLNGDGLVGDFVDGSINDGDFDDGDLSMHDILDGQDPLADLKKDPLEELRRDPLEEMKKDPLEEMKKDPLEEMKKDPLEEMKKDPLEEMKKDPLEEMKKDPLEELKKDPLEEMKKDPLADLKKDPLEELKKDPFEELKKDPLADNHDDPFASSKPEDDIQSGNGEETNEDS
ncbi:MAG: hypothetical protein K5696_08510 [Lachnospiraceae bacterium]|nr:hypothetical protein [Lachnospiraceae bacterium]